jgi:hypothetical protein
MQTIIDVLRSRSPSFLLAAVFNGALIALLLTAAPKHSLLRAIEPETQVVFLPLIEPVPALKNKRMRRGAPGRSNAITTYFNPYTFNPQVLQAPLSQQKLEVALASCAPENYDKQSDEVRTACARIRTALAANMDRAGVNADFLYGEHWQRELTRRETPYLAPCMTPGGPDVLYFLYCVYDVIAHGYDKDKMPHY